MTERTIQTWHRVIVVGPNNKLPTDVIQRIWDDADDRWERYLAKVKADCTKYHEPREGSLCRSCNGTGTWDRAGLDPCPTCGGDGRR